MNDWIGADESEENEEGEGNGSNYTHRIGLQWQSSHDSLVHGYAAESVGISVSWLWISIVMQVHCEHFYVMPNNPLHGTQRHLLNPPICRSEIGTNLSISVILLDTSSPVTGRCMVMCDISRRRLSLSSKEHTAVVQSQLGDLSRCLVHAIFSISNAIRFQY